MCFFFFFNDTATTEIYTLSLHDALPICSALLRVYARDHRAGAYEIAGQRVLQRSEEHTSELQSRLHLVCRLLLEKKKKQRIDNILYRTTGSALLLQSRTIRTRPLIMVSA